MNELRENEQKKNESVSYIKKWTEGKMNYSITVEKVDGGFIISNEKYGNDENDKYISECKKSVSTVNPLDEEKIEFSLSNVDKPIIE